MCGTDPAPLGGEPGGAVNGLRTERVTLEVTHRFADPISSVLLQALGSVLSGQGESVFVMDGSCEITNLTDERDAAIRERDQGKEFWIGELRLRTAERDTARARVAELESQLESAPAASGAAGTGWLTGDERLAVSGAILILDQHGPTNIGRTLNDILARSSPPEVVRPGTQVRYHRLSVEEQRDDQWLAALAAAGVTVKEVGRE